MDLTQQIQELYLMHEEELSHLTWASEADRWAEFVFCLVHRCSAINAHSARDAVRYLHAIGALRIDELSVPEGQNCPASVVVGYVFRQFGMGEREASDAVNCLRKAAAAIEQTFGGKMQRFLRRQGEQMRDELVQTLSGIGVSEDALRFAVSHWLQNALSIPISLESQALVDFCSRMGASLEDLYRAVDKLEINMAIVDDLIEMQNAPAQAEQV